MEKQRGIHRLILKFINNCYVFAKIVYSFLLNGNKLFYNKKVRVQYSYLDELLVFCLECIYYTFK